MTSEESIADWKRMHDDLTDPEKIAENRRNAARLAYLAGRRLDTGYGY